jgi:coenzyme F420-reducing hydrogenase delta subunit
MTAGNARETQTVMKLPSFAPSLAVFHCRWCLPDQELVRSLLPEEVAARSQFLRINCSARMEAEFAIKALAEGYDGVIVLGCEIGECHYLTGNHQAVKRLTLLKKMLVMCGIYPARLGFFWVSPYDEEALRKQVRSVVEDIVAIGPFKHKKTWIHPRSSPENNG